MARPAKAPFDRGPAVHQCRRRPRAGLLQRRIDGGHRDPAVEIRRAVCDCKRIRIHIQGQQHQPARNRPPAWRPVHRSRRGAARPGKSTDLRTARRDRYGHAGLGGYLRARPRRRDCPSGRAGPAHRRAARIAVDANGASPRAAQGTGEPRRLRPVPARTLRACERGYQSCRRIWRPSARRAPHARRCGAA